MGGYGSGKWVRYGKKTTAENSLAIDLRILRKKGLLSPGA